MPIQIDKDKPKMTGSVQTMLTWTRVALSEDEIPSEYLPYFNKLTFDCEVFPYTLIAPPMKNRWYKPVERLITCIGDQLFVLEKQNKKISQQSMHLNPGIDLELGNSLLFSWITLRDLSTGARTRKIILTFNAATARHYEPLLRKIRPSIKADSTDQAQNPTSLQKALVSADFKFNHFAQESILPGEMVRDSLWQPAFKTPSFTLLGKNLFHIKTLAHMTILTQSELILLWDDERGLENRGVRYGGIRRFIPIKHIKHVSVNNPVNHASSLFLTLSDDSHVYRSFESNNQNALLPFSQRVISPVSA
jgi:hypothetical protein